MFPAASVDGRYSSPQFLAFLMPVWDCFQSVEFGIRVVSVLADLSGVSVHQYSAEAVTQQRHLVCNPFHRHRTRSTKTICGNIHQGSSSHKVTTAPPRRKRRGRNRRHCAIVPAALPVPDSLSSFSAQVRHNKRRRHSVPMVYTSLRILYNTHHLLVGLFILLFDLTGNLRWPERTDCARWSCWTTAFLSGACGLLSLLAASWLEGPYYVVSVRKKP